MLSLDTDEAKANFNKLIKRAEAGKTILITCHGKPVARIVPLSRDTPPSRGPSELAAAFDRLLASQRPGTHGEAPIWKLKHERQSR